MFSKKGPIVCFLKSMLLTLTMGATLFSLLALVIPVHAASITVETTEDELNENGKCSLREAIVNVNRGDQSGSVDCPAGNGNDTIVLPAGTYTLTRSGSREDQGETGDLDLRATVTIRGDGPKQTIIRADNLGDRVLHLHEGAQVTIQGISITDGRAPAGSDGADGADGGGVYNDRGSLTCINCVIRNHFAGDGGYGAAQAGYGGRGGGVYNLRGSLTLVNTLVSNNHAGAGGPSRGTGGTGGSGGGIANNAGTVTIINSTISENAAGHGGCHADGCRTGGDGGSGGGILNKGGTVELFHTTISSNRSGQGSKERTRTIGKDGHGGGIANEQGTVIINHTILAGNDLGADTTSGTGPDCWGKLQSHDYNLLGNRDGCSVEGQADHTIISADPKLSPLGDHGGEIQTHALLAGSPAIDAGNPEFRGQVKDISLTADQRGAGYRRIINDRVDIGAFEASPEIAVFFYAQNLANNPLAEFGNTQRGMPIRHVFTITNVHDERRPESGTADLILSLPVTLPKGFSLVGDFPRTVPVNQLRHFTLQLDAEEAGRFEGTVEILNNDNDQSPFTFKVTGHVATGPEIEIWDNERNIKSTTVLSEEMIVTFPAGVVGRAPVEKFLTIKNVGDADLIIEPNKVESPTGFSIKVSQIPPRIPAKSSNNFLVRLDTTMPGVFEGAIRIYSNDADENPFTLFVRGKVLKPEEMRRVYLPLTIR